MPAGWKWNHQKPEFPPTNYEMFDKRMINGQARAFKMPMNIAAGNSEGYNYASGRLDHQSFWRTIKTARGDLGMQELNKLFFNFFIELGALPKYKSLMKSLLPKSTLRKVPMPVHTFMFPGLPHVDPKKEADAFEVLLRNDGITLETWFGEQGKDWRTETIQMGVEKKFIKKQGLTKEDITNAQKPKQAPAVPNKKA
jgi:capsid protein